MGCLLWGDENSKAFITGMDGFCEGGQTMAWLCRQAWAGQCLYYAEFSILGLDFSYIIVSYLLICYLSCDMQGVKTGRLLSTSEHRRLLLTLTLEVPRETQGEI